MRAEKVFWILYFLAPTLIFSQEQPRVRNITIRRANVFDASKPSENRPPYTWVNKVHILTKEYVIEREILFKPGDSFDPYLKLESERNLRQYTFIKNAEIETIPIDSGSIDLVVRAQDTWTTELSPSLGTVGGKTNWGLLARERNFLGLGKTVEFIYNEGFEAIGRRVYYLDPRVLGSRISFEGFHTDHTDGYESKASINLPAYSLLTPISMKVVFDRMANIEETFTEGVLTNQYRHQKRGFEAVTGKSLLASSRRALRLNYGYQSIEDVFSSSTTLASSIPPDNRTLRMAKVGLHYIRANYIKEDFIGKFERYEDFNLAPELKVSLGYSARPLGAPQGELVPNVGFQMGKLYGSGHFAMLYADTAFRYRNSGFRHIIQSLNLNYYRKDFLVPKNTLVAHSEIATGLRLDQDAQLILGGDNGLRGYKLNAFTGTRSLLTNIESRWFAVSDWLHVVSLAPIVFWDAGYVWPKERSWKIRDLKHDIGLGLRIGMTRSATNPVVRMDVSYALNSFQAPDSRWLFSLAIHHAFKPRNNSLRRVLSE